MLPDTKRMQNIMYFLQQAILRTNIARIINPKASKDKLVKKLVLARNHSQTTEWKDPSLLTLQLVAAHHAPDLGLSFHRDDLGAQVPQTFSVAILGLEATRHYISFRDVRKDSWRTPSSAAPRNPVNLNWFRMWGRWQLSLSAEVERSWGQ